MDRCQAEAEGRSARECAGEGACGYRDRGRPALPAAPRRQGCWAWLQLVLALHFGTCCVLDPRGCRSDFSDMLGLPVWCAGSCLVDFVRVSHSRSPARGVCPALAPERGVGNGWRARQGCLGALAPSLRRVNFAELCSLEQGPQTGSVRDRWPAPVWPLVRGADRGCFCLSGRMQIGANALPRERETPTRYQVRSKLSIGFSPFKEKTNRKFAQSPRARIYQQGKRLHSFFRPFG